MAGVPEAGWPGQEDGGRRGLPSPGCRKDELLLVAHARLAGELAEPLGAQRRLDPALLVVTAGVDDPGRRVQRGVVVGPVDPAHRPSSRSAARSRPDTSLPSPASGATRSTVSSACFTDQPRPTSASRT